MKPHNQHPTPDLLSTLFANARLHPEKSRALPQQCYGDPALHVKFPGERACSGCIHIRQAAQGAVCGKGQPFGKRCAHHQLNEE